MTIRSFNNPLVLLLSLLVALSLVGAWNYARDSVGIDYFVFWASADATRNGTAHGIYDWPGKKALGRQYRIFAEHQDPGGRLEYAAKFKQHLDTSATPFLYWVVGLISTGDYDTDLIVWSTLTLLCFSLAVLVLGSLLRLPAALSLLLLLASLVWLEAMRSELRVANANGIQLGLVLLSVWLLAKDSNHLFAFLGGAVTALTVLFKPNLGPVVVLVWGAWLLRGDWRKLLIGTAGMASATLGGVVLSGWFFGDIGIWVKWFDQLGMVMGSDLPMEMGNLPSSNWALFERQSLDTAGQVGIMLAWCAVALGLFWWGRRRTPGVPDSPDRLKIEYALLLALGCVIHMTVSSVVWVHYYLLVIPMVVVALRPWSQPEAQSWGALLFCRFLPVMAFVMLLDSPLSDLLGVDADRYLQASTGLVIAILMGAGFWQLAAPDPRLPVDSVD